jgi:hypothetical protein
MNKLCITLFRLGHQCSYLVLDHKFFLIFNFQMYIAFVLSFVLGSKQHSTGLIKGFYNLTRSSHQHHFVLNARTHIPESVFMSIKTFFTAVNLVVFLHFVSSLKALISANYVQGGSTKFNASLWVWSVPSLLKDIKNKSSVYQWGSQGQKH